MDRSYQMHYLPAVWSIMNGRYYYTVNIQNNCKSPQTSGKLNEIDLDATKSCLVIQGQEGGDIGSVRLESN